MRLALQAWRAKRIQSKDLAIAIWQPCPPFLALCPRAGKLFFHLWCLFVRVHNVQHSAAHPTLLLTTLHTYTNLQGWGLLASVNSAHFSDSSDILPLQNKEYFHVPYNCASISDDLERNLRAKPFQFSLLWAPLDLLLISIAHSLATWHQYTTTTKITRNQKGLRYNLWKRTNVRL